MRLLSLACLGFVLAALSFAAPPAVAGGYAVTSCFGYENGSWSEWEPAPFFTTAYVACPGGVTDVRRPQIGEGLMVRNVVGPRHAPWGTAAALRFDAPAGTTITGFDFDARLTSNHGWVAGVFDRTHDRWLWCGPRCLRSFARWTHEELRGLATRRVEALVRCTAVRCRRDARRGLVALRDARVYLDDPSAPRLDGVRGLAASGRAWLRGRQAVAFDAADNSGIRRGRVVLDGRVVHDGVRGCDFTRPVPCSDGAVSASFDTRTWADGQHGLRLSAEDAGGNWASVGRVVRVDNTAPLEPSPKLDGGDGWSPRRTRWLVLPLPGGQAAPLTRARVRTCRAGGACEETAPELRVAPGGAIAGGAISSGAVAVAAFDGPGEYSVRVALEDAAGNVGPYAAPLTMRFDDTRPGAPDVSAADEWLNGGALPLAAMGARPASGIRGFRVRIGGRETEVATIFPLDDLPEGHRPVEVSAVSGAGVDGAAVRTQLKLDRSRPLAEAGGAPDGWSRTPVSLSLRGRDQARLSGVRSLAWRLDGGKEATAEGDAATVDVAEDGRHTVMYRAIDGAGNSSESRAVAVKVDTTPPETVAFEATDPAQPRRVSVVAIDRMSGVAIGRIELRRAGGAWKPVATTIERDRVVGQIDDAALRAGAYELRAVVADAAGNETVGTRRVDGAPATLRLPLRRVTTLSISRSGRLLRARLMAGDSPLVGRAVRLEQRLRGRTMWHSVCGRRTVIVALRRSPLVSRIGTISSARAGACTLRTDEAGRIEVRLPAGPSRRLRFEFAGDALLLPARGTSDVRTPARVRLTATPRLVRPGGAIRLAGRLLGGHVPRAGKLVELQALVGAGWRTFATVRSDRRGTVRHAHRFGVASGARIYLLRLRVRRELSYPFETGTSRAVAVRVM